MSYVSNAALELADFRAEEERRIFVERAQAQVRTQGTIECQDCMLPIDDERRGAAPFARRCIDCQRIHEKALRRKCA
ncbi:TraR/DksA C4-type zinc finger protein [Tianweitania sediminis]|uniref:TraR/DksA C4-type zinc finger protein n=1 Tax=Tianweitania sediminis TaxID=1502156 RepID=A0A8J7R7C7_9HYPH|nr:TraR/DksA C4-type zinc finger protein [Tianweitania sediminis]